MAEVVRLFEAASGKGHARAALSLAMLHDHARGKARDDAVAVKW